MQIKNMAGQERDIGKPDYFDRCKDHKRYKTLVKTLKRALLKAADSNKKSLLFIEFDYHDIFPYVFGSNIDDKLTEELSEKLKMLLNEEGILAKVNTNQYLILHTFSTFENEEDFVHKVLHLFDEPFLVDQQMFYLQASIGVSFYPKDGIDILHLVRSAYDAMRDAKKKGSNHYSFSLPQITLTDQDDTIELMKDFPAAIENGEIYFHFQPQYSSKEERFTGAEVLARWEHPYLGDISPSVFIPLAEQSGMISALTIKELIYASKVLQMLKNENIDNFSLSINISPVFLTSSTFLRTIKFILDEYHQETHCLNFEITEESLIKSMDYLSIILVELKSCNIGIELDDFGTGYTSLKHLATLPIDTLKIDKSFISGIDKNRKKQALFKAIVDISKSFEFDLIAEGVENRAENDVIQAYDSIKTQGYYHAKPMDLSSMIEYLKSTQNY